MLASGDILLRHSITPHGNQPDWLPKVGLQMVLGEEFDRLAWNGRGPYETYPDRRTGARIGVFESTVEEQYVPYLVPQDYGNKSDVRWVSLANAKGVGLLATGEELLNVSAQHYGTDNLSRAWYPFQLDAAGRDHPEPGPPGERRRRDRGVGAERVPDVPAAVRVRRAAATLPGPAETPRELARQGFW